MVTVDSSVLVTEFYTLIRINQYRYSSTHSFIQTGTLERFPKRLAFRSCLLISNFRSNSLEVSTSIVFIIHFNLNL